MLEPAAAGAHPDRVRGAAEPGGRLLAREPARARIELELVQAPLDLLGDELGDERPERLEERLAGDELRPAGHASGCLLSRRSLPSSQPCSRASSSRVCSSSTSSANESPASRDMIRS